MQIDFVLAQNRQKYTVTKEPIALMILIAAKQDDGTTTFRFIASRTSDDGTLINTDGNPVTLATNETIAFASLPTSGAYYQTITDTDGNTVVSGAITDETLYDLAESLKTAVIAQPAKLKP